jgi:hypothetical protein
MLAMVNAKKKSAPTTPRPGHVALTAALVKADPRPTSSSSPGDKITYATRFADAMAEQLAIDLAPRFPGIDATTKRSAVTSKGKKQLDISFSTPKMGLALGVSLKSVHVREAGGRYTHNMKRNDEELGTEASVYHERQPWAVMAAVMFLPFDACDDGKKGNPSSFGSWVRGLRPRVGRSSPGERESLLEKGYIALYQPDGSNLQFFDIESAPPKHGVPGDLLSYANFIEALYRAYTQRNHAEFRWADGDIETLSPDDE